MEKARESITGTVPYAASKKSYEAYRLIFTSNRVIAASLSWREKNIFLDLGNLAYMALVFPFSGPNINTDSILMRRWSDIKNEHIGRSFVSYKDIESEEILKMGLFGMILHEIQSTPYSMIKKITVQEDPFTHDYRVRIGAGPLASSIFLIPEYSLQEFRELVSKTPLARKLV